MSEFEAEFFSGLPEEGPSDEELLAQEAARTERLLSGLFQSAGMTAETPEPAENAAADTDDPSLDGAAQAEQEEDSKVISLLVNGRLVTSEMLGLSSDRDLELLAMLPDFKENEDFRAADAFARDFHASAAASARKQAFPTSCYRVANALEDFLGQPALTHTGSRSTSRYQLRVNVSRLTDATELEEGPEPVELKATEPAAVANHGLAEALARRREEEQTAADEGSTLKAAVRPHIEAMIDTRHASQEAKKIGGKGHLVGVLDNRARALGMHWGVANGNGPIEAMDFEDMGRDLGLTPYSARTLVREALKEMIRDAQDPRNPSPNLAAAKSAKDYLEYIDRI